MLIRIVLLFVVFVPIQSAVANGCSDFPTLDEAYAESDFVAMAKLTNKSLAAGYEDVYDHRFEISEFLKGSAPKELVLRFASGEGRSGSLQYLLFLKDGQTTLKRCGCCVYPLDRYAFKWYSDLRESRSTQ